jgi:myo-inositol-1(or 4)-monophosphatase
MDFSEERQLARDAAIKAGEFIASNWNKPVARRHKGAVDLVTEVDLGAEAIIVKMIGDAYPDDTIIAEEGSGHQSESRRTWYVDPLDGTTNFSHGVPHFAVSIGLVVNGIPTVGVIYEPIRKWCFHGQRGQGAWMNETPIHVSDEDRLSHALLATGFPYDRWTNTDNNVHRCDHLLRQSQGLRRAGAAALDLAYVAAGWLDGYWEIRLSGWDVAAGLCLVVEAGGVTTGLKGEKVPVTGGNFVATNGRIHDSLVLSLAESEAQKHHKALK